MVIERAHQLGQDQAHQRIRALEEDLRRQYGFKLIWQGHCASFSGRGFSGGLEVSATEVCVDLKLGLLARPFPYRYQIQRPGACGCE